jgi:hypothetical protein
MALLHKRRFFVFAIFFIVSISLHAQITWVTKTYSQNRQFYLKSVPYDDEQGTSKGTSSVYNSNGKLLYTIDRGFNDVREYGNFVSLSNDSKTIFFATLVKPDEKTDGLKSISIYKNGLLTKSFTLTQITNCNTNTERCNLVYYNLEQVVDFSKSKRGTPDYKKVFKEGVSEQEAFLCDHAIFMNNDTVYLTDSKRITHLIDLNSSTVVMDVDFNTIYPRLRELSIQNFSESTKIVPPHAPDQSSFPNLINGNNTGIELAKTLGMTAVRLGTDFFKYKVYQVHIGAYISRNGDIKIATLEADKPLPLEKITAFFNSNKYDASFFPAGIDKWYFHYFFWGFRNASDQVALAEKEQEMKQRALDREKRLTLDSINHIYIPLNLKECLTELDKMLPAVAKNEMQSLKNGSGMISYHFSLGLWVRNNWGLWGGSRLQTYFHLRGFDEPDGTSGMILSYYYEWLNGKKNIQLEFESKYPVKN